MSFIDIFDRIAFLALVVIVVARGMVPGHIACKRDHP
jgi:hypothetical protein